MKFTIKNIFVIVLASVSLLFAGQAMAKKSHYGFGMNIIFYDPYLANKSITKKMKAKEAESIKNKFPKPPKRK